MSGLVSGTIAAGLLATVAMVAAGRGDLPPQTDIQEPSFAEQTYRLQLGGDAHSCLVERGGLDMTGHAEIRTNAGCESLFPGLAEARFWNESRDGTVAFTSDDGAVLIEFSVSDGAAYQTFQPGVPLGSLTALN